MAAKIPTGVPFFDTAYGGAFKGRVMLVTGKSGTGKSIFSLQFIAQGLKANERCLLLSARPAEDVALYASAYGMPVDSAIESNNLIILEYSEYVPGRDREDQLKLPPDSFIQLKQIIEEQAIDRVVLDTVLPWVAVNDQASLAEHVFSFVRVFHRLGTSSVFTLPKPASPAASRLRKMLEEVVPISVTLSEESDGRQLWVVNKYLGIDNPDDGVPFEIKPQVGIAAKTVSKRPVSLSPPPEPPPVSIPQEKPKNGPADKPSFSELILRENKSRSQPPKVTQPASSANSGWTSIPLSSHQK